MTATALSKYVSPTEVRAATGAKRLVCEWHETDQRNNDSCRDAPCDYRVLGYGCTWCDQEPVADRGPEGRDDHGNGDREGPAQHPGGGTGQARDGSTGRAEKQPTNACQKRAPP